MTIRGTGRPHEGYFNKEGKRLPSVTTVTGARKTNVEGLLVWANRLGREGKDHREVRDQAADAGSLAHAMVENAIHGKDPEDGIEWSDDPTLEHARTGFASFVTWQSLLDVHYVATETPMISEWYGYGGTPDAIGRGKDGKLALFDWKTSNGIYGDYLIQLGA